MARLPPRRGCCQRVAPCCGRLPRQPPDLRPRPRRFPAPGCRCDSRPGGSGRPYGTRRYCCKSSEKGQYGPVCAVSLSALCQARAAAPVGGGVPHEADLGSVPALSCLLSCNCSFVKERSGCWMFCRKAEEYLRLSQVKCTGLMAQMTATSSAVMCLDLAASFMKQPVDKSYCVKLSGLNKTTYQSSVKSLECLLGVNSRLGMRDLAVQFCCMEAVSTASKILQRYESSLSEAQQMDLDFSKPLFTTAALFTACRQLKLKVDKSKMVATSGVKKAIFERLCSQLEKMSQQLSNDVPLAAETPESLQTNLEHCEKEDESEDDETPCKQPKTETKQDYEEWKKRILENAAKAQKTNRSTASEVPSSNITAACS
ncbi:origin recognition complex subunit 6 isoform X2 [Apteryx mantelli]|uniref:Origin recognition complex subunit 6 isoform X2 n=1 Tax=Apteryx mantelli TaxID=2696672 RepID=A0ABM4F116_9AVES